MASRRSIVSGVGARLIALLTLTGLPGVGCSDASDSRDSSGAEADARPGLCARPGDDAVRDIFCSDARHGVAGLSDLQRLLELSFDEEQPEADAYEDDAYDSGDLNIYSQTQVVVLNASTALSGRLVSTLNPRVIVLGSKAISAFNRGVQQVELISRDRVDSNLNMYLLRFEQACNAHPHGCSPGDLYTPRIESDWRHVRVDDDEDLKNTEFDCRQCHQRARERPMLLMRELDGPWTHFFAQYTEGEPTVPEATGADVVRVYYAAKGEETYGGVPWRALSSTSGFTLQRVVNSPQPLVFDGGDILNERWPWTKGVGFATTAQRSETWYREYEAFKRGEHLALPHFDPFPSDAAKLSAMMMAYQAFLRGELHADDLPELSDVYPDDPQTRAEIGFQTEPLATSAQALVQACASCHNDVLDQGISRARFNIDLSRMSPDELALAAARIALPLDAPGHMPPVDARQLDPAAIAPLIAYLRAGVLSAEDAALLQGAAQMGMANLLMEERSSFLGP